MKEQHISVLINSKIKKLILKGERIKKQSTYSEENKELSIGDITVYKHVMINGREEYSAKVLSHKYEHSLEFARTLEIISRAYQTQRERDKELKRKEAESYLNNI